jgi:type II secretory pathway pseudopilin PulG
MSAQQTTGSGPSGGVAAEVASAMSALGSRMTGVVALAVIILSVVLFRSWLDARDDRMRMEATLTSQGTVIAAAQKREQDRAQQLADTLKQIADLKRTVQTPQQVIREIPQFLPALPQPIEPLPSKDSPAKPGEVVPQDVRVPAADLKPLFDFAQDCRACQAKLTAAQQDLKDEQVKSSALTTERDAAVKAAKGGGIWRCTARAAKWLAVGFAVGYAVHAVAR